MLGFPAQSATSILQQKKCNGRCTLENFINSELGEMKHQNAFLKMILNCFDKYAKTLVLLKCWLPLFLSAVVHLI